jgi:hypothetical protein
MKMAEKIEDGGPAFPVLEAITASGNARSTGGMSLRDYFAGQALAGFLSAFSTASEQSILKIAKENGLDGYVTNARVAASVAYGYADAMLAARKGDA